MTKYQLTKRWYQTKDQILLIILGNQNRLSLNRRYGIYAVTTGTHIILIFIVVKSADPEYKFDLYGKVVLEMVNVLKDMKDDDITNCEFFLDYFSTSYKLKGNLSDERHRNCKKEHNKWS